MQFHNLTPFSTLCFAALDPAGAEHRVIAMKVGYRLVCRDGIWRAEVIDVEPTPLCTADEHWGVPGQSSVRQESDLAPFKPLCDILVNGNAYAPGGVPTAQWDVRLRVSTQQSAEDGEPAAPQPLNPLMGLTNDQLQQWDRDKAAFRQRQQAPRRDMHRRIWLDKRLSVSGPSHFHEGGLMHGWRRSQPVGVTQVPLRWEYAFGGRSTLWHPKGPQAPPVFNEVCFSNPLGCGWMEHGLIAAAQFCKHDLPLQWPAPQIEYPDQLQREPVVAQHPEAPLDATKMAEAAQKYSRRPAGFGNVGRAWAPRLPRAGTYDEVWLEHRHPGLPADFDFGYWNGAPDDQQIPYLSPQARIELWHLTEPKLTAKGHLLVDLPGHRAFVLMRLRSGAMLPLPMVTDTVLIDTQEMTMSLTHRTWIHAGPQVRLLEARFEVDAQAPLIRRATSPAQPA
jgi:hypothetical protein